MPFNMFPYSNLHNFNLDWILNTVKALAAAVEAAASTVETYAARLAAVETGAVRHDVSQALDAANRRRAATNIHAVSYDPQLLSANEQAQARTNIGAASASDIPDVSDAVRYSAQDLTPTQQTRARLNIGATSQDDVTLLLATKHYVKYDEQTLTDAQKAQARANIGAAYSGDITDLADRVTDVEDVAGIALTYAAQTPTNAQKAQARANIGAGSAVDVQTNANEIQTIYGDINNLRPFVITFSGTTANGNAACDKTWSDVSAAFTAGRPLTVRYAVPPAPPGVEDTVYILNAVIGSTLTGKYLDISDPSNPGDSYANISCTLFPNNRVLCDYMEV